MGRRAWFALGAALGAAFATACSSAETPPPSSPLATLIPFAATPSLPAVITPTTTSATPTATALAPPAPVITQDPAVAQQAAITALARELGVPESQISVISIFPQQWDDTSLGCPQPDQVYAPVITAGYLITLGVGDQNYNVHTDLSGTAIVCLADDQTRTGTVSDPAVEEFIQKAQEQLAEELDVALQEIAVVRSESVEWTDSSLGCAAPGQTYAQVITPGYRIVLAVNETWYEFHTDQDRIFLCESPTE